jgi:hypothetical protein
MEYTSEEKELIQRENHCMQALLDLRLEMRHKGFDKDAELSKADELRLQESEQYRRVNFSARPPSHREAVDSLRKEVESKERLVKAFEEFIKRMKKSQELCSWTLT